MSQGCGLPALKSPQCIGELCEHIHQYPNAMVSTLLLSFYCLGMSDVEEGKDKRTAKLYGTAIS
jgi:hypothetical protein